MKKVKKHHIISIFIFIVLTLYILNNIGVISFDTVNIHGINLELNSLRQYLNLNSGYAMLIFVALWIFRLVFFIPGVTLMLLGGMSFGAFNGFILSMLGMVMSETLVYIIAKIFGNTRINNYISKKHPEMAVLVEKYNLKFLGLGILCPIAPTDAICFLSASTGINYLKFILTVIIANIPVILSINYIGIGFNNSIYTTTMAIITISLITYYTVKIWYQLRDRENIVE